MHKRIRLEKTMVDGFYVSVWSVLYGKYLQVGYVTRKQAFDLRLIKDKRKKA